MIKRQRVVISTPLVVISTNGRNLKIPRCARNDRGCGRNDMRGGTDKKQHGFSLVSAIFLLVVIAALGTFAVTLSPPSSKALRWMCSVRALIRLHVPG